MAFARVSFETHERYTLSISEPRQRVDVGLNGFEVVAEPFEKITIVAIASQLIAQELWGTQARHPNVLNARLARECR
jgi:hypothetical protein